VLSADRLIVDPAPMAAMSAVHDSDGIVAGDGLASDAITFLPVLGGDELPEEAEKGRSGIPPTLTNPDLADINYLN
jgi:hypothetical protein